MSNKRFEIRESIEEGIEYFDVYDNVTKEVVGWYSKLDTDGSGMNYGYDCAVELMNDCERKAKKLGKEYFNGIA
tara:strand:- start:743 stop:964 length:222 start_codon:yes stop_codon:yes gene_type:complete